MLPKASTLSIALGCCVLGAALVGDAWSQPGTLISHTKYSSPSLAPLGVTLDNSDEFGDNVVGLGDLDGAGPSVRAIAVGAILDDDGGNDHGAVYILFLNSSGNVISKQKISSTDGGSGGGGFGGTLHDNDVFGTGLAWLGDLDGAGPSVGALAIGVINDDDGGSERGAVYICFLNSSGKVLSNQKISNTAGGFTGALDNGDEFGGAICSLGDLDGPGGTAGAIAVGANRDDDGGFDRGAVWVLFLNTSGSVVSHTKINSASMNNVIRDTDSFGEKLATLGDIDGPGGSAIAIASSTVTDDDGANDAGAVYICFLNTSGDVTHFQKISASAGNFNGSLAAGDGFGAGLAELGDLDGSGESVCALAVGASNADGPSPGFDRGTVFVLFLDNTGNVLSHEEISNMTGSLAGSIDDTDEYGSALGSAGDLDGPGGSAQTLVAGVALDDDGGVDQLADRGAIYIMKLDGAAVVGVGNPPLGPVTTMARVRPNPFSTGATVAFRMSAAGHLKLEVFDTSGRVVRRLLDRDASAGEHRVGWNGADDAGVPLATGCYLVKMTVNGRALPGAAKAVILR